MKRILLLFFAFVIIAFIVMEVADNYIYWRHAPRCSDFFFQEDAQTSLGEGNSRLDGDKDGVACEELPNKNKI